MKTELIRFMKINNRLYVIVGVHHGEPLCLLGVVFYCVGYHYLRAAIATAIISVLEVIASISLVVSRNSLNLMLLGGNW